MNDTPEFLTKKIIERVFGIDGWHEYEIELEPEKTYRVNIKEGRADITVDLNMEEAKKLVIDLASQLDESTIIDCLHDALKNAKKSTKA